MPRYKTLDFCRSAKNIFTHPARKSNKIDLSDFSILHSGIDTVRQLYNCTLKPELIQQIETHKLANQDDIFSYGGIDWIYKSSGKSSGYQHILKNLEMGYVILLKGFFTPADRHGSHLKFEATPQAINSMGLVGLSNQMRIIANLFADTVVSSGVSVHLACDVQGFEFSDDFEQRLMCKSKPQSSFFKISEQTYNHADCAIIYGKRESITFGKASGLQFCLYDKTAEATKSDKLTYWESIWSENANTMPMRDKDKPVHRFEFRIHQSIVKEFETGHFNKTGELVCIRDVKDIRAHLAGLWRYCLNNFRLHYNTNYVDPIWTILREDVVWSGVAERFIYCRAKKSPAAPSRRNVALWIGNLLRLKARQGIKNLAALVNHILNSGLLTDINDYMQLPTDAPPSLTQSTLHQFLKEKLTKLELNGVCF